MKAKDLAALLLLHPDLEVTFQHQRVLESIVGVVRYKAFNVDGREHWVKPPPEHVLQKMIEKGVSLEPVEVLALYTFLDRQFESDAKVVI
jgi:hypothetical protein